MCVGPSVSNIKIVYGKKKKSWNIYCYITWNIYSYIILAKYQSEVQQHRETTDERLVEQIVTIEIHCQPKRSWVGGRAEIVTREILCQHKRNWLGGRAEIVTREIHCQLRRSLEREIHRRPKRMHFRCISFCSTTPSVMLYLIYYHEGLFPFVSFSLCYKFVEIFYFHWIYELTGFMTI